MATNISAQHMSNCQQLAQEFRNSPQTSVKLSVFTNVVKTLEFLALVVPYSVDYTISSSLNAMSNF